LKANDLWESSLSRAINIQTSANTINKTVSSFFSSLSNYKSTMKYNDYDQTLNRCNNVVYCEEGAKRGAHIVEELIAETIETFG
jgi:hypothetical protein